MRNYQLTVTQQQDSKDVSVLLRELRAEHGVSADNLRELLDVMQQQYGTNKSLLCTKGICNQIRDFYSTKISKKSLLVPISQ